MKKCKSQLANLNYFVLKKEHEKLLLTMKRTQHKWRGV